MCCAYIFFPKGNNDKSTFLQWSSSVIIEKNRNLSRILCVQCIPILQDMEINRCAFTQTTLAGARFLPRGSAANLSGVGTDSTLVLIDGFRQTNGRFQRMTILESTTYRRVATRRARFLM